MHKHTHTHTGFLTHVDVTLSNTSEIPMTYHLRVPGPSDQTTPTNGGRNGLGGENIKEFEIQPSKGNLPPNYNQAIKV